MTSPFHRLYFTLFPDRQSAAVARDLTAALRDLHRLDGRPTAPERLHISLNFVGRSDVYDERVAARAIAAAETISARPFVVALDRVVSWKGDPRPLVLTSDDGVIGVHALYDAIHSAMTRTGLARGKGRAATPHMTLMRDPSNLPTRFIRPISWAVKEFALVHSVQGEGRHNVLGRWAL